MEFAFARTLARSERFDFNRLRQRAAALGADRPALDGTVDWDRVARQRAAIYVVAGTAPPVEPAAPDAERIRALAYARYLSGELAGAVQTFEEQATLPEGAVEMALFAEGLADMGDVRAAPYIRRLSEVQPTEADAAAARLALRLGQYELAQSALVSALVRYRTDPWPSQVSMSHALALADELTLARRDMVPVIFEALGQRFAVSAIEEARRLVRLSVESHGQTLARCHEALGPFEPHVPWRADVLQYRADCYARTRDPRAQEARSDLERYKAQDVKAGSPPQPVPRPPQ